MYPLQKGGFIKLLNKKTLKDIKVSGKKVLVRCDFNVPFKDGAISDQNRIISALPTIKHLLASGAKVILCSHLGKGAKGDTLAPVAVALEAHLGKKVTFADDGEVVGQKTKDLVANMGDGDIILLQNTRFSGGETTNCAIFSKELASLSDCFVFDAFGTAHRAHASTVGVTEFLKESAVGFLVEKELKFLGEAIDNPQRPFVAILGGAKVSDKINVIANLLDKVDTLIIGGGMAYTFIKAMGHEIGASLLEEDKIEYAKKMLAEAKEKNVSLLLPIDTIIAKEFKNDAEAFSVDIENIKEGYIGVDIGAKTIAHFEAALRGAKTVIWNGPMGVFEMENFAKGTKHIAKTLSEIGAVTIIGGGDSAAAVNILGYGDKMSHISTGGGASLKFLEGVMLPALGAIAQKDE